MSAADRDRQPTQPAAPIREKRRREFLDSCEARYRLLLRLLPSPFRARFQEDLARAFRDQCRFELDSAGGPRGMLRLWSNAIMDVAATAWRERGELRSDLRRSQGSFARDRLAKRRSGNMHSLIQDVRYSVRTLLKRPGFLAAVVLSLGLGIGANSAVFSIVDGAVLNPLPYPQADRLMMLGVSFPRLNQELDFIEILSPAECADIQQGVDSLEHFTVFDLGNRNISGGDRPQRVFTALVWGDPFKTFAMQPAAGRGFSQEELEGKAPAAIISYRTWQTVYGGDAQVVGKPIRINGQPVPLVGVMPPRLYMINSDLWLPMGVSPQRFPRKARQFNVLARLKEGADAAKANAELEVLARRVEQQYVQEMEEYRDWRLQALSYAAALGQQSSQVSGILLGAVAFVLLVACANVANLLLSRTARRRKEMAIRAAVGAGTFRICRPLVIESVLLALLGGAFGLGLTYVTLPFLLTLTPQLPAGFEVSVNLRVLAFTLAASLLSGLLFGLAPAFRAAGFSFSHTLKSDARSTGGLRNRRIGNFFVMAQVALALLLLAGAGVMTRSFMRLSGVDPGFDTANLLVMRITLPRETYSGEAVNDFFSGLAQRVRQLPGVREAGIVSQYPPFAFYDREFQSETGASSSEDRLKNVYATIADEGLFKALAIPAVQGRLIEKTDTAVSPPVAVLNQAAAERFFPGTDAVGQRIRFGPRDQWIEIVGVARDVRNRGLQEASQPEAYVSMAQMGGVWNQLFLVVRTESEPMGILPTIRQEVASIDPDQPVYGIQTIGNGFASTLAQERLGMAMLGMFSAIATLLAVVGIYGVVSYNVNQRRQEMGLRLAIGADRSRIVTMVVGRTSRFLLAGTVVGLLAAIALGGFISSFLFEVSPSDPATLAAVSLLLLAIGLAASLIPAIRAGRVDPAETLRSQ